MLHHNQWCPGVCLCRYSSAVVRDDAGREWRLEPDLTRLFLSSNDYDDLAWAWKGWRDAVGPAGRDMYEESVRLQNAAATQAGENAAQHAASSVLRVLSMTASNWCCLVLKAFTKMPGSNGEPVTTKNLSAKPRKTNISSSKTWWTISCSRLETNHNSWSIPVPFICLSSFDISCGHLRKFPPVVKTTSAFEYNSIFQIEPLYLELHAYVRYKLQQRYPEQCNTSWFCDADSPIPAHLLGTFQILKKYTAIMFKDVWCSGNMSCTCGQRGRG